MELTKQQPPSSKVPFLIVSTILTCSFFFIFRSPLELIVNPWLKFDEAYSHGLLTLGIVIYLLYLRRETLLESIDKPNYFSLCMLVFATFLCVISSEVAIDIAQQLLLPAMLWLTFTAAFGLKFGLKLLVPFSFLYFAIPFWDYLAIYLQKLTVVVCEFFLDKLGVTAFISGLEIYLPDGIIRVATGCSGLRYLLISLLLSSLYGVLNLNTLNRKLILILFGALLGLAANWIRVFSIIVIADQTQMTSPLVEDHESFGWAVFAATLVPLFVTGYWLAGTELSPGNSTDTGPGNRTDTLSVPGHEAQNTPYWNPSNIALLFNTSLIIFIGFLMPSYLVSSQSAVNYQAIELKPSFGQWGLSNNASASLITPNISGHKQHLTGTYEKDLNKAINLQVFIFPVQSAKLELVRYNTQLFNKKRWAVVQQDIIDIDGKPMALVELKSSRTGKKHLLVYTYYVANGYYTQSSSAKLASLKGFFNGRRDGSAILLDLPCKDNCLQEKADLIQYATNYLNELESLIVNSLGK